MHEITQLINNFPGTVGFYLHDLKTGEKLEHNPDKLFPMASTYKIPILVQLFRDNDAGLLSLEEKILLKDNQTAPYSLLNSFSSNTSLALKDLALLMIAISDNTATDIILKKIEKERINVTLAELGIYPMSVDRTTAEIVQDIEKERDQKQILDDKRDATTPKAMGMLIEKLLKNQIASQNSCSEMQKILMQQIRNARFPRKTSGFKNLQIAHKTGTTRLVTNDVGFIKLGKRQEIILCIYTAKEHENVPTHVAEELIGDLTERVISHYERQLGET